MPLLDQGIVVTYTLEDLLSSDVVEAGVEVLDTCCDVLDLSLVAALDLVGLADDEVEGQLDAAVGFRGREPAGAARVGRRREAQLVVSGVGGGEGEAARGSAALGDDTVVVVEDFLVICVSMVVISIWGWLQRTSTLM